MHETLPREFATRLFHHHHRATIKPRYLQWRSVSGADGQLLAVLGYRGAGEGPLLLESYLDQPVEDLLSAQLGRAIERREIVEIGCLAATPSAALVRLWCETARLLGQDYSVAVATLTEPLRQSFARVGMPFVPLVAAAQSCLTGGEDDWGDYYHHEPWVCVGDIADGAVALSRYAARLERAQ